MNRFHPFFIIGSVGIIVTSILHILFALVLSLVSSHSLFFALYPTFMTFMIIGMALTLKKQKDNVSHADKSIE